MIMIPNLPNMNQNTILKIAKAKLLFHITVKQKAILIVKLKVKNALVKANQIAILMKLIYSVVLLQDQLL